MFMKTKLERMIIADMVEKLLKAALKTMVSVGEFDKIYKHPTSSRDRVAAIELKKILSETDIDSIPLIPLIMMIDSADVWKNILVYMIEASASDSDE